MRVEAVSREELFKLIMTRPPYFALQNMSIDREKNIFTAHVTPEQSLGAEVGPISTSEAGRHLAIAGLSHIALNRKDKNYYLAVQTIVKRSNYVGSDQRLKLNTFIEVIDRREASVTADLSTINGTLIYQFLVTYSIFPEKIFKYKYRNYITNTVFTKQHNPYTAYPPKTLTLTHRDKHLRSQLEPYKERDCLGHYPGLPFAPIAILMQSLLHEASKLITLHNHKNVEFRLLEADMSARKLIAINTALQISTRIISIENLNYRMKSSMYCEDTDICVVLSKIQVIAT